MAEQNPSRLSIRRQKYKANRALGMDKYNAARAAGYSESFCKHKSYALDDAGDKVGIRNELVRQGATDRQVAKVLLTGLNDKSPEIRRKYAELIVKLAGHLEERSLVDQSRHQHITYVWANEQENHFALLPTAVPTGDTQQPEAVQGGEDRTPGRKDGITHQ